MIELEYDALVFTFPEVHPDARLHIDFQRTLRIPDDDKDYPLPPGLGRFPLRHVDDFAKTVPGKWLQHGGVMLPMYQSESMWLFFNSQFVPGHRVRYPFAVKIATGKINAVDGKPWENNKLSGRNDHVVVPKQPWLDGYCVEKGIIRQFVAMPLGAGHTVEEQLTGSAEHGGLQIAVYAMKREAFLKRFPKLPELPRPIRPRYCPAGEMGLAPGGRMKQEIYEDPFEQEEWDQASLCRCFVHIANSLVWRTMTGKNPPTTPPTAKEYTWAGLPWFDYYSEGGKALEGSKALKGAKSVVALGKEKGDVPLPENESVAPAHVVALRTGLKEGQVREGVF